MPDGRRYFVMELLDGETLRERLVRAGTLGLPRCARIARQLAPRARGRAREGHRPSRSQARQRVPRRRCATSSALVKLLDFGIAKLARRATSSVERARTDRRDRRHADVHLARAGARLATIDWPRRHLLARLHRVRAAHRQAAVPGRDDVRDVQRARHRDAGRAVVDRRRRSPTRSTSSSSRCSRRTRSTARR